jgi:hypothetical protein
LSGQENLAVWHAIRQPLVRLENRQQGRNWLAERGTHAEWLAEAWRWAETAGRMQAERDRPTCSSRQRATGEGRQAGRGHGGRLAKPEAKLPDDGCV